MKKFSLWCREKKEIIKGKCAVAYQRSKIQLSHFKNKIKGLKPKKKETKKEEVKEVLPIEEQQENQPKIVVKKHHHLPSLIISKPSPRLKKAMLVSVPCFIAIAGIGLGIGFGLSSHKSIEKQVVIETNKTFHRVYLISSDQYVIPLSVKMDQRATIQEEMLEVFSCLKTNSKVGTTYLRGYIPENATVKNLDLANGILTLNFSEEFLQYEEKCERQMLESLVYTFLDFDGVNSLVLEVNGKRLEKLPVGNSVIPENLDITYGINRPSLSGYEIMSKDCSIVYYEKSYDQETSYYVPVSVYTEKTDHFVTSFYDAIQYRPSVMTGLKKLAVYNQIDQKTEPLIHEDGIVIGVTEAALMEEGVIHQEIYEMLLLSFDLMGKHTSVSLQVNGETYQVNGYYEEEVVSVSDITVNIVAI